MNENIWNALLSLRSALRSVDGEIQRLWLSSNGGEVVINPAEIPRADGLVFSLTSNASGDHLNIEKGRFQISQQDLQLIEIYVFTILSSYFGKKRGRSVSIAHFAQSLDGKIATISNRSKWIGNTENLTHAHRMRALCDGILIGTNTLRKDEPELTVRHVPGDNPRTIFVGKMDESIMHLLENYPKNSILFTSKTISDVEGFHCIKLDDRSGIISCDDILKSLYDNEVYSVYIEGGSYTTSRFLADGSLDILQLHISPMIFGSGQASFELSPIKDVEEAIKFRNFIYQPIGDGYMFFGLLNPLSE